MRLALAVLVLGACGRVGFDPRDSGTDGDDDAPAPDASAPCNGPFQAARVLSEIASVSDEAGGTLSDDQLEIVFGSDRPGGAGGTDLYTARRASKAAPFNAPERLAVIDTAADEDDAYLDADGVTLWYNSGAQILRSTRADRGSAWRAGSVVNDLDAMTANDDSVTLSADGLVVYFSSDRVPTVGGTGLSDLYHATRPTRTSAFGTPVQEAMASSNSFDCCPEVLPGGTQVAFSSQRNGLTEVWVAPRAIDNSLGVATKLPLVDSPDPYRDYDIFATRTGEVVGVSSTRPGGSGNADIWLYERSCP